MSKQRTLKDQIRDHYHAQSLSEIALERLIQRLEEGVSPMEAGHGARFWRRWGVMVGVAALLLMGIAVGLRVGVEARIEKRLTEQVAREVALNHRKAFAPEIRAASFAELAGAMVKLDFQPIQPSKLRETGVRLVGGRYCSIGDCIAVQVTVILPDGRRGTLYEVRPNARLAVIDDAEVVIDDLRVRLWREGGLLLVFAEPLNGGSA